MAGGQMRSVCEEHFEANELPAEPRDHNDDYSTQDGDRRPRHELRSRPRRDL
jgi:hypothetical protein